MDASQPHCPAVGFQRDGNIACFPDRESLIRTDSWTLKTGDYDGMELVDACGASWRVRAVKLLGRDGPLWRRPIDFICGYGFHIELDLEPLPPVPFRELVERICRTAAAHPDFFYDEEIGAGEGRLEPLDWPVQFAHLTGRLRRAADLREICAIIDDPCDGILPDSKN